MRRFIVSVFAFQSLLCGATLPNQTKIDAIEAMYDYASLGGCTTSPSTGAQLQAALDTVASGGTICLTKGVTYTGPFVVDRAMAAMTTVRTTSTALTFAVRVNVSSGAGEFAKLFSTNRAYVLYVAPGAKNWRFVGIEIYNTGWADRLVAVGANGSMGGYSQTSLADIPLNIGFDRLYVHGIAGQQVGIGFDLNADYVWIRDTVIDQVHDGGQGNSPGDNQAILFTNMRGPVIVQNSYLHASGENIMFGGSDPAMVIRPEDIVIRGNYFYKNPALWGNLATWYATKNLAESKNAKRVLFEGNVFENQRAGFQSQYYAIVLKSANQGSVCKMDNGYYSQTSDITIRYNRIKNVYRAFGLNRTAVCQILQAGGGDYWIHDNLITGLGEYNSQNFTAFIAPGLAERVGDHYENAADVTVEHNTVGTPLLTTRFVYSETMSDFANIYPTARTMAYTPRFTMRNNVMPGTFYMASPSASESTVTTYWPNIDVRRNLAISGSVLFGSACTGGSTKCGNYQRSSYTGLFIDESGGNYRLTTANAAAYPGTDGMPAGADITLVEGCTAGVDVQPTSTGSWTGCTGTVVFPPTTVSLLAAGSSGPISVASGAPVSLTWDAEYATACTASGGWTGSKSPSGSSEVVNPTVSATYDIVCTGDGNPGSSSVTINVVAAVACAPPPL